MKTENIGYIAGKIKNRSKSYISGQLQNKNGITEIAQLVYDLDIVDMEGNIHTLRTNYENIANQDTYLHFFYDDNNVIMDTLKCYSKDTNYIAENPKAGSTTFYAGLLIFIAFALFIFKPLMSLMIPFESGAHSLTLSIFTTIPVALDTMAIWISGMLLITCLHEDVFSNIPKSLKYRKYKLFKKAICLNNTKIKEKIVKQV